MTMQKPEFHLQRVYNDGTSGPPEILPLLELPVGTQMGRRGFLGTGLAAGSIVALLSAASAEDAAASERTRPAKLIRAHTHEVKALAIAPDGKSLVSGSQDKTIKIWSLPDGKLVKTLEGHTNVVNALAITPDGKMLVSGSSDKTIQLWSLPDGKLKRTLEGQINVVKALAITPDGKTLVSGASDKTIKLWSLPAGELRNTLVVDHTLAVNALAITSDGETLASGSADKTVKLWSLPHGEFQRTMEDQTGAVYALVFARDGKTVVSGSSDKAIKRWALSDGALQENLEGHAGGIGALAITAGGKTLASGSADKTVKLWTLSEARGEMPRLEDKADFRKWKSLSGEHTTEARLLQFTATQVRLQKKDGKIVDVPLEKLSPADRDHVQLLRARNAAGETQPFASLEAHRSAVRSLAATPNQRWLASGDSAGVIILWDLPEGKNPRRLFDPKAVENDAITYNVTNPVSGETITYTLPCGSPVPAGATCTCNCVPGTFSTPRVVTKVPRSPRTAARVPRPTATSQVPWRYIPRPSGYVPRSSGGSYCSCVPVCTCVPICQAHRLLDSNPTVRQIAEQLLLVMGIAQRSYMSWAADGANRQLRSRIYAVMDAIDAGAQPDWRHWPTATECIALLDHTDEVVAIMAAQMLAIRQQVRGTSIPIHLSPRVASLLHAAAERPWYLR